MMEPPRLCYCRVHGTLGTLDLQHQQQKRRPRQPQPQQPPQPPPPPPQPPQPPQLLPAAFSQPQLVTLPTAHSSGAQWHHQLHRSRSNKESGGSHQHDRRQQQGHPVIVNSLIAPLDLIYQQHNQERLIPHSSADTLAVRRRKTNNDTLIHSVQRQHNHRSSSVDGVSSAPGSPVNNVVAKRTHMKLCSRHGVGSDIATSNDYSTSTINNIASNTNAPIMNGGATPGCCAITLRRRHQHQQDISSYSPLAEDESASSGSNLELTLATPRVGECVKNVVQWLGHRTNAFIDALPAISRDDYHVVMIGLDSAGKTTVLYRLKFDQYVNTVPTIGFNCERVRRSVVNSSTRSRNLSFLLWDVGGQEKIRPLWRPYTRATDAVIFVVDSCDDGERMEEAKMELHRIMRAPDNANVPLVVLANKQDLPEALSPTEIEHRLALYDLRQLWRLESACAVTGEGLEAVLDSLVELVAKKRKMTKRARNKTR